MASLQHPLLQSLGDNYGNEMQGIAPLMSQFLKAISHEGQLMILFHLADGEKPSRNWRINSPPRQSVVSQHLSRLRIEGLVLARREGKFIYYRLADKRLFPVLEEIMRFFAKRRHGAMGEPHRRVNRSAATSAW